MEEILQHVQEILGVPAFLINHCDFLPQYIRFILFYCVPYFKY